MYSIYCGRPQDKWIHAFLDTLIILQPDGSLTTTVYRKFNHTDLYLQWDSHHTTAAKYSVVSTLHHRTRVVCSNLQLLQNEEHLQKVLTNNEYPAMALNRVKFKITAPTGQDRNLQDTNICANVTSNNQRPYVVVPYG